jgi:hypothetical protein
MADDEETTPPAEGDLPQRVGTLEGKIDQILGILGKGDDKPADPAEPGGGTNIAHEIRQQLDERDQAAKKKADEDGLRGTVGELQTKLSELTEKPPAPMPRRIEKLMGWS